MATTIPLRGSPNVGLRGAQNPPSPSDYSGMANRAQSVAGKTGGQNYSPSYAPTFKNISSVMKGIGSGASMSSMLGNMVNSAKFTKNQKETLKKYNDSAQKLGQQTKKINDLKGQVGSLQGQIDALKTAGCEFVNQMDNLQDKMDDINDQIKNEEKIQQQAQDKFNKAQQDFKNAMTPSNYPRTKSGLDQQRQDATNAKNAMNSAQAEKDASLDRVDGLGQQYSDTASQYNSTLDQSNANLSKLGDSLNKMDQYNLENGKIEAERADALQQMAEANQEFRAEGQDYLNGVKNWGMVSAGGSQMNGWSDSVAQFGNNEFYNASASSLNQSINTLRQFGGISEITGGVGDMVTPFLEQAITTAGKVMEAGGTAQDFGMTFMQATMGLGDWMQGAQSIENALSYMDAGDNFMSAVELNNSVSPFFSGASKVYQTSSIFTGTTNPLSGMVFDFVGDMITTTGAEIISDFEISKAGGDLGGSLVSAGTSPLYSFAHGITNIVDKVTSQLGDLKTNWSHEIEKMRTDFKSELSGIDLFKFSGVDVPKTVFDPTDFTPTTDPNNPSPTERLKDPFQTGTKNTKGCPVPKPAPSSIATELD